MVQDSQTLTELIKIGSDVAKEAGALALSMRNSGALETDSKSSSVDMVTNADKASEKLIVEALTKARPKDGLVGEEGASKDTESGLTWYVDPIDGTTNFIYGMEFSVSLGVCVEDQPVAAIIYTPMTDTLYTATLDGGSYSNSKRLSINSPNSLSKALIATGFGYDPKQRVKQAEVVTSMIDKVRDIRRTGAASLDFTGVATGKVDGYYEVGPYSWDTAAGLLIASEAGAKTTAFSPVDQNLKPIVAAAPNIFDELLEAAERSAL